MTEAQRVWFHRHFCKEGHSELDNWKITLIDQVEDNLLYLRQK